MIEKFAAKGKLGSAVAVGHEAEVADAMETVGQRMKQEAANELVGLEIHDLCRAVLAVILPCEGNMIVVECDEPAVGDRGRGMVGALRRTDNTETGVAAAGCPLKFSRSRADHDAPAPVPGAHTAEVLRDLLGLDSAGIAALRSRGVV